MALEAHEQQGRTWVQDALTSHSPHPKAKRRGNRLMTGVTAETRAVPHLSLSRAGEMEVPQTLQIITLFCHV